MYSLLKPFIFKIDPEMAHDFAIKSLKYNFLPEEIIRVQNEEILETEIFDTRVKNPIGLAAGFDKSGEVYNSLFRFGFGFIEIGTVTPKPQYGNPKPRLKRLVNQESLLNSLGFNNDGTEEIKNRLEKLNHNCTLGINIGPNKSTPADRFHEDYSICMRSLAKYADCLLYTSDAADE